MTHTYTQCQERLLETKRVVRKAVNFKSNQFQVTFNWSSFTFTFQFEFQFSVTQKKNASLPFSNSHLRVSRQWVIVKQFVWHFLYVWITLIFKDFFWKKNKMAANKTYQFKLVLLGDTSVGKSSIVIRFVKGQFSEYQESTIGGLL